MSNNKEILIGVKIQVNNEKAIRKIVESQKKSTSSKKADGINRGFQGGSD